MSVLERLSSASGDPTEASNKAVVAEVLECPELLDEVAAGLEHADRKLLGDCVEVFTEVAKVNPALAAPYAARIIPLLGHKDTRVRWEATHAVALVAALVPDQIAPLLPDLAAKIERDKSVIVRDCAVIALGEYGRSGPEAARQAFSPLRDALEAWQGKHAKLALEGMAKLLAVEPALGPEVQAAAQTCLDHKRANVRRLAQQMAAADENG
jgi:HEAT repeat protein